MVKFSSILLGLKSPAKTEAGWETESEILDRLYKEKETIRTKFWLRKKLQQAEREGKLLSRLSERHDRLGRRYYVTEFTISNKKEL